MTTHHLLAPAILALFLTPSAFGDEAPETPPQVTAYGDCAVRAFATSSNVSEVLAECKEEMDAFVEHTNEKVEEERRFRALADRQREELARERAKDPRSDIVKPEKPETTRDARDGGEK